MAKLGRPTLYSPELATKICKRLAAGESLSAICREENSPSIEAVSQWLLDYEDFRQMYATARRHSADLMAEDILDIASNQPDVNRARLMIDTRKWIMARMQPRKYGDNIDMTSGGAPISISIDAIIGLMQQAKPPALPAEEAKPVTVGDLTI